MSTLDHDQSAPASEVPQAESPLNTLASCTEADMEVSIDAMAALDLANDTSRPSPDEQEGKIWVFGDPKVALTPHTQLPGRLDSIFCSWLPATWVPDELVDAWEGYRLGACSDDTRALQDGSGWTARAAATIQRQEHHLWLTAAQLIEQYHKNREAKIRTDFRKLVQNLLQKRREAESIGEVPLTPLGPQQTIFRDHFEFELERRIAIKREAERLNPKKGKKRR